MASFPSRIVEERSRFSSFAKLYRELEDKQKEAVMQILCEAGGILLTILPKGFGKSLVFQT